MASQRQRERKLEKGIAEGKKELTAILSKRKRAISGTVSEFTGKRDFAVNPRTRNKLYRELGEEYKKLNLDVNEWTVNNATKEAKQWWGYAKSDLPKGAVTDTFGAFSKQYIDDILGQINPATVDKTVAMGAQIGGMHANDVRALRAAVSTTIAEGAVEGLTNKQMADRMQAKIKGKVGQFQFVDKAGRKWKGENYFGMLNRTIHANAARDTYVATATDAGFDLFQIEGGVTGSSLENASDPCDDWAGTIISMTGSTKGYPTYQDTVDAGMWHPACVHFLSAVPPSEMPAAKKQEKVEEKQSDKVAEEREEQ